MDSKSGVAGGGGGGGFGIEDDEELGGGITDDEDGGIDGVSGLDKGEEEDDDGITWDEELESGSDDISLLLADEISEEGVPPTAITSR